MQQRDLITSTPHTPVTLNEGGLYALQCHVIYLAGLFLCGNRNGRVCHTYLVGVEDRTVVTAESVSLFHKRSPIS